MMWNLSQSPPLSAPFAHRYEYALLALLLLSLYLVLWPSLPEWGAQVLLLTHVALFFLWQWFASTASDTTVFKFKHAVLLLPLLAGSVVFLNAWSVAAWKLLLLGVLAGRYVPQPGARWLGVAVLAFCGLDWFLFTLPLLFDLSVLPSEWREPMRYALLLVPLSWLFLPPPVQTEQVENMDFFHGLTLMLSGLSVALGAVLMMQNAALTYAWALLYMGLVLLGLLLSMSWLWLNFGYYENLPQLWSRHGLNLGSHFEQWLANLTQPGTYKALNPEQFLDAGLQQLSTIPWLCGIGWQSPYGQGALGQEAKHKAMIAVQSLEVTLYSRTRISGPYYAHLKLLVQLLEHFHQAKRREEAFAQQAHLKAIHETGAKLTHDIKNLLQSLYVITSAIESAQPQHFGDTQRLLQGQLPHLSQRLKRTLDKLQQPGQSVYNNASIRVWWDNLQARYRKRNIEFSMSIMWNANIPEDLFDNVVENLLENALNKRKREPDLRIRVALECSENQVRLTVCDTGTMIQKDIEKQLLNQPVPSRDGFGIGLYQAAKQTIHTGYRLHISHNQTGQVCFELASV